jgi:tetratricopeptide (TPR) repeat protein
MRWKTVVVQIVVAALLGLAAPRGSCAQEAASPLARAVELMKNRQYGDAVKILRQDVEGKPEAEVARQLLMLGECCYVTHAYEEARPLLAKALRNLTEENEKTIAEYRLACTHFRLKD